MTITYQNCICVQMIRLFHTFLFYRAKPFYLTWIASVALKTWLHTLRSLKLFLRINISLFKMRKNVCRVIFMIYCIFCSMSPSAVLTLFIENKTFYFSVHLRCLNQWLQSKEINIAKTGNTQVASKLSSLRYGLVNIRVDNYHVMKFWTISWEINCNKIWLF